MVFRPTSHTRNKSIYFSEKKCLSPRDELLSVTYTQWTLIAVYQNTTTQVLPYPRNMKGFLMAYIKIQCVCRNQHQGGQCHGAKQVAHKIHKYSVGKQNWRTRQEGSQVLFTG